MRKILISRKRYYLPANNPIVITVQVTFVYYVIKVIIYHRVNAFKQMNYVKYIKIINAYYVNMFRLMESVKYVMRVMNHFRMDNVSRFAGMD